TLAETEDRILATALVARWRYAGTDVDWNRSFHDVRRHLLDTFASRHSLSLQQTLYAMGTAALEARPEVAEVRMTMSNKHHFAVDLSPFGMANENEVFYASDRPYGLIEGLGDRLPGLAMASRTVGSPQIRNRGTVGGNLGTSSPAGDAHPPLLASDAQVEVVSKAGTRRIPIREFFTGPKKNAMQQDELIAAFLVEPAPGAQQFSKVGTRNAMVIAVCSFALALDPSRRRVGTGIGS